MDVTDFDAPGLSALFETIVDLSAAGRPHDHVTVLDELQRRGRLTGHVGDSLRKCLLDATTSGASGLAVSSYACAVVSDSYRRRFETWGRALAEAAGTFAEHDLMPLAVREGLAAREHSTRLAALRGEQVAA